MSKPAAIITTLEDSAPWLDQRLVLAYLRSTYRVQRPSFDLHIGQLHPDFDRWLATLGMEQFALLTAWNPGSQPLPAADNARRNQSLEIRLRALAAHVLPGWGISADGDWPPEASFCALGLAPEQAVTLGRAFGQNALVYGQKGGAPELWWLPEL